MPDIMSIDWAAGAAQSERSEEIDPVGDDLATIAGDALPILPGRVMNGAAHGDDGSLGTSGDGLTEPVEAGHFVKLGRLGRISGSLPAGDTE